MARDSIIVQMERCITFFPTSHANNFNEIPMTAGEFNSITLHLGHHTQRIH